MEGDGSRGLMKREGGRGEIEVGGGGGGVGGRYWWGEGE